MLACYLILPPDSDLQSGRFPRDAGDTRLIRQESERKRAGISREGKAKANQKSLVTFFGSSFEIRRSKSATDLKCGLMDTGLISRQANDTVS